MKFTPCPEFSTDVLQFLSTSVNVASVIDSVPVSQLQGVDASAHVSH